MPNSIATLVRFVVICHRVGVDLSLCLFGDFVSVKTTRKEGHCFFQNMCSFKLVSNTLDSNNDWKEKFMWVFGADPILSCPTWPEIKKDTLKPCLLLAKDGQKLEKIQAYAGSRRINNLFESTALRVAGISRDPLTEADTIRAAVLALSLKDLEGMDPASAKLGSTIRPQKRLRKELAPEELKMVAAKIGKFAARLAGLSATAQVERSEKKRRRLGRG